MSPPDPEERVPIITSEGALDSNRRPHEYMLNKSKGRERQRVNRSPSMRTASDGDHHGAVTESRCNTLGSVVCTHGWMPTRDITTLAAQAHCNVTCKKQLAATVHKQRPSCRPELHARGVFAQRGYHKMAPCTACAIKTSQTLLQAPEDDQSFLPMSLVASLDTVPVTCCVPLQRKLINGHETVEPVKAATDGL